MSKAGNRILQSAREALAFASGLETADTFAVHIPASLDAGAIRRKLGLSQVAFAAQFGIDKQTLQAWEAGRAVPDAAAQTLLCVIEREPEAVRRALAIRRAA